MVDDDPSSFLFGLNQFASPGAATAGASGSGSSSVPQASNHRSGSTDLLADALGNTPSAGNDLLAGTNFAEQLALWTNANFSFDGPTGHALLGDEDKDKGEGSGDRGDRGDRGEPHRGEGGNDNNNAAGPNRDASSDPRPGDHAFAPRPGRREESPVPREEPRSQPPHAPAVPPSSAASPPTLYPGAATVNPFGAGGVHGLPFGGPGSAPPQHNPGATGFELTQLLALQQLITSNPVALASLGGLAGLSPQFGALAASGAFPPATAAAAVAAAAAANGHPHHAPQPQLQHHQQQPHPHSQAPPPAAALHQASFAAAAAGAPAFGGPGGAPPAFGAPAFPFGQPAWAGFNPLVAPQHRGSIGAIPHPPAASPTVPSAASSTDDGGEDVKASSSGGGSANGDSNAASKKKKTSAAAAKAEADEQLARDDIPPLKLIDTGNPEADAEANRLAIEEDKRRRNTAASARFRVKKKQREAALEASARELSNKVRELEAENARLRTENGWLKGLIQVRPGGGPSTAAAGSNGAAAAAPRLVPPPAPAPQPTSSVTSSNVNGGSSASDPAKSGAPAVASLPPSQSRLADNGIRPRGVGTSSGTQTEHHHVGHNGLPLSSAAGSKRDREEH